MSEILLAVSKFSRVGTLHKWRRAAGWWYSECGLSEKDGNLQAESEGLKNCKHCFKADSGVVKKQQ